MLASGSDHSAAPPAFHGWDVYEHRDNGPVDLTGRRLHVPSRGGAIRLYDLHQEIECRKLPAFNADNLRQLLEQPHLIDREWRGLKLYAMGTVYWHANGPIVLYAHYWGGWREYYDRLDRVSLSWKVGALLVG